MRAMSSYRNRGQAILIIAKGLYDSSEVSSDGQGVDGSVLVVREVFTEADCVL